MQRSMRRTARVKIAVHSGTQPSIQMCIDAGFDTIEHGTFLTEAQARQMAKRNRVDADDHGVQCICMSRRSR